LLLWRMDFRPMHGSIDTTSYCSYDVTLSSLLSSSSSVVIAITARTREK